MEFFGKIVDGMQTFINVNPSTFSGAIDVIAAVQEDGSIKSTPFHVRFGKLLLINARNKKVKVIVNDERVHGVCMRLDQSGQAFFIHETDEKPEGEYLEDEFFHFSDDEDVFPFISSDQEDSVIEQDRVKVGSPEEWSFGVGSLPDNMSFKSPLTKERRLVTEQLFEMEMQQSRSLPDLKSEDIESQLLMAKEGSLGMDGMDLTTVIDSERNGDLSTTELTPHDQKKSTKETPSKSPASTSPGSPSSTSPGSPSSEWSFGDGPLQNKRGWRSWLNWRTGKKEEESEKGEEVFEMGSSSSEMGSSSSDELDMEPMEEKKNYYYKSLRPSPEQLKKMNLKNGVNKMVFIVENRYLECNIFLWDLKTKIVVTDIDGTITKSDVLGHIFLMLGKDWAQSGVTSLLQNIKANGYNVVYLTARSIGTNKMTKKFLANLVQNDKRLPLGPVLLSPDRLLSALNREVITKEPHVFKIACLDGIVKLFPKDSNPIYAGFGNQPSDFRSYKAVGVPLSRIYTINSQGEIVVGTSNMTYTKIDELLEHIFPPLNKSDEQWNDFQFWNSRLLYSLEDIEKSL